MNNRVEKAMEDIRVSLEEYLNNPLVQQAREPMAMVKAAVQSYFQQGHILADELQEFPEGTVHESPNGSIEINMEKLSEWCQKLPWLDVPNTPEERARWMFAYQYGQQALDQVADVKFTPGGGLSFRCLQPADYVEFSVDISEGNKNAD